VLDKSVSYCQGMNYIVAVLLIFMEEEVCREREEIGREEVD